MARIEGAPVPTAPSSLPSSSSASTSSTASKSKKTQQEQNSIMLAGSKNQPTEVDSHSSTVRNEQEEDAVHQEPADTRRGTYDEDDDNDDDYDDTDDDDSDEDEVDGEESGKEIVDRTEEHRKVENCNSPTEEQLEKLTNRIFMYFKSIILWENSLDTASYLLSFNIIYWFYHIPIVLHLTSIFATFTILLQLTRRPVEFRKENEARAFRAKCARFDKFCKVFGDKIVDVLYALQGIHLFTAMFILVFTSSTLMCTLPNFKCSLNLLYVAVLCVFIVPVFTLWCFGEEPSVTEKDGEILDFIPEVDEDNLEILNRAGESGTSPSNSNSTEDDLKEKSWEDEDLENINMPSHEEDDEEESEDDLSSIEFAPKISETANFAPLIAIKLEDLRCDSRKRESMPSHEEVESDEEIYDMEHCDDETDGVPTKRQRFDDHDSDESTSSDSSSNWGENSGKEEKDNTGVKTLNKEVIKLPKHLSINIQKSDSSSDDDFEIIDAKELEEAANV